MKFNILKLKILKRCILSSLTLLGFYCSATYCEAANVTPIYLGKDSIYVDSDIPPAIRLNESVDGLAAGTYLYRTKHHNITYYSPVAPAQYRNTIYEPSVNVQYRNWGPWKMARNQIGFTVVSGRKYHNNVTIPAGKNIQGPSSSNANVGVSIGSFSANTSVPVRAYSELSSGTWIYFSLKGTKLEGKNPQNIGRVKFSDVSTDGKYSLIFRSGSTTKQNFSYLGNYKDTTDSSHVNLETGKWVNSSSAPDGLAGQKGEWSCIGYNSKGEVLDNPYFPAYNLHFLGSSEAKYYDWRENPFTEKSTFDSSTYDSAKRELLNKMLNNGILLYKGTREESLKYYLNRFSYLTHPTKDTAILRGKRIANTNTRQVVVENEPGDLYIVKIEVYDGNTKVAYYDYDIHTNISHRSNGYNIVKGRKYTVKVQLGNSKNRKVLASKIQATIGITKESKFLSLPTVTASNLTNVARNSVPNTMGSYYGGKSDFITFNVTAPSDAQVFDIYGLVGEGHHGTDNLEYNNDASYVRMYTAAAFDNSSQTIAQGNLKATSIELLDASNNSVVYSSSGSVINTAIIPGKSYKIRYTMKNIGGRPTIVTNTAGYEGADGTWYPGTSTTSYPTVEIPISYTNTLKVQNSNGTISNVSVSGSNKKVSVNGSTQISLQAGGDYIYTTEALYFSTPYLYSSFTINATDLANSNKSDDTYSTTIQDLYDAVISDVKISPAYEYVFNGDRHTTFNVTYKAKINAPSHIKNVGYVSSKVNTSINVGNKTVVFQDVLIAKDGYQEFSHTVENVLLRKDTTGVRATVKINYDCKAYETNYNNNTGQSNYSVVKTVANPFDGSNSDTVIRVDTSDGSSLNGGGVLNNNCLIPRRNNSWTVSHRKHSWNYSVKNYSINGGSYSSEVYTTSNESTVNKSYTESFKIKNIFFKSKETEGRGDNGWVDLLASNQANLAKVKAGYGFELKIISEYRTNATKTQPTPSTNTNYSGIIGENDISYSNEIFVNLPGTEGTNGTEKILSTTGYFGTTKGLEVVERDLSTSTEIVKEFTYTIKPSNTLGIGATGKIFIPTELKDGNYKVSIYTPPIIGAVSSGKNNYTSLCDRSDIYIKVSGSYTDDLNSNIIQ